MGINLFMSHTANDFALADALAWQLERAGHRVVMNGGRVASGADITSALSTRPPTQTTIAVLSPSYLAALADQPAAVEMVRMQATGAAPTLVAVRVRECTPDDLLPGVPYIDLVGLDDETAMTRLRELPSSPPIQPPSRPMTAARDAAPGPAPTVHDLAPARDLNAGPRRKSRRVFVSYSHRDKGLLDRLLVHFTALQDEEEEDIDVWSDRRLRPGDDWRTEIKRALESACVAVLLVSPDFLASPFIRENELPPLLEAAETRGTRILPVIVGPSHFEEHRSLSRFHAMNDPKRPLRAMKTNEREAMLHKIAKDVDDAVRHSSIH